MIVRDEPAGATTDDGRVIPDVIVFPVGFPSPSNPDPQMPSLDNLHFAELVFGVLTGIDDLQNEQVKKHIWWHELRYTSDDGGKVKKKIYNAYDESITLQTQAIDFERISDVSFDSPSDEPSLDDF
jgi:hypothetical protein